MDLSPRPGVWITYSCPNLKRQTLYSGIRNAESSLGSTSGHAEAVIGPEPIMDRLDSPRIRSYTRRTVYARFVKTAASILVASTKSSKVASMAVLIAEWCFVIGEEVEYVWKGRWTYLKVFYLLSRYTPFLDTPFNLLNYLTPRIKPETCLVNYKIAATSTFVGMSISEYILIARTYALYGRSRTIGLFMLITVSICTVAGAITLSLFEVSLVFGPLPSPEIPGCILSEGSNIAFVNFIILLGWEFFIVCLTAYKGIRDLRITRGPMAQTLYRDGIFFFFILLLLSTANIIVFVVAPLEYLDLVDTLTRCLHSIICCRVLLNLRGAANDTGSGAPSTGRPVSSLRFMKVLGARRTPEDSEFDSTVGGGSLPLHELGSSRPADPELER